MTKGKKAQGLWEPGKPWACEPYAVGPWGRNCRRTLLTQLTDLFSGWTLLPTESSPPQGETDAVRKGVEGVQGLTDPFSSSHLITILTSWTPAKKKPFHRECFFLEGIQHLASGFFLPGSLWYTFGERAWGRHTIPTVHTFHPLLCGSVWKVRTGCYRRWNILWTWRILTVHGLSGGWSWIPKIEGV